MIFRYNRNMVRRLRKNVSSLLLLAISFLLLNFNVTKAADLTNTSMSLDSKMQNATTNHTFTFKLGTPGIIKDIELQYTKAATGDPVKPTGLNLSSVTFGSATGLTSGVWGLDTSAVGAGIIKYSSYDGESKNTGDQIGLTFNTITNPALGDCSVAKAMYDQCYVNIKTYSDFGTTLVDSTTVEYRIEETPALNFSVSGVIAETVTNGTTTTVETTSTAVNFGALFFNGVEYGAQKLHVATTAANGYTVKVHLDGYMEGINPANKIDPFSAVNAAWSSPQSWSHPTGTTANSDTGWLGANTSDTRVPGWSSASGKFGPVSSTRHEIMASSGPDSGTDAYVTYAIEVNQLQPPDRYSGVLVYEIAPTY